ncbi:hypothetical protein LR48_Vigan11g086200 [Vigna angularis]|uniref:Uncharacterized protein n=2 Tax=Phaseolus angularis TaxID=3914 RepID=A0A0L9VST8_PHAAN|nr:uncharacterized protein LOC108346973 [Vigna angularis]XP_017441540.1 uncharacterized protein LOC108346973 [Vigna angularis]KAG2410975.1 uncharacterized protein HKW66_Vig0016400 [Vigna angularis]KOM57829.1 hypothetical protein LR48_Vigan11g086200 [Vigna angularis]BAT72862.1 hypothetical protein VIGAN_01030400 [Vigna angularis var. angularis]
MEYQAFGRAQRPKVAIIKQALKVMLVLAVGSWMLYQIKQSRNDRENYSDETNLVGGHGAKLLGRKGILPRVYEIDFPDSGNVDSAGEAKESSSGSDDGSESSDGAKEDKAEAELVNINEKFSTRERKEVELEPKTLPEVLSENQCRDSSKTTVGKVGLESRSSESGHKKHGIEKYPKRSKVNDSKSNGIEKEVQLRKQLYDEHVRQNATLDFSEKENDGDEGPKIREKETGIHKNVVEGATNAELTEEIDEVQSFHDENGAPPDVNETEIVVFGRAHIVHEENLSNVSKGSWLRKHIYEVTHVEDNTVEVNPETSKNDADEETNAGNISAHYDTSGIKHISEIGEADS